MPLSPPLRHAIACLVAYSACDAAHAAEWSAQPSIWWYLDYDTNRRLAPQGQGETPDDAGYMTLDLLLQRLTETGELSIHPQLEFQRFTTDSALDATNGSLQLLASHRELLWSITTTLGYSHNSTLITELASTGIIDASSRQDSLNGDVSVTRDLSELQSIAADVSYADVTYPGGLPAGLVDYKYYGGSLTYSYQYSQRSTFSLVAFGSELRNELEESSDNTGAKLQWQYIWSSLITMTASAGASQTHVSGTAGTGAVYSFSLVRRTDQEGKWSFTVLQDVEPNGFGTLFSHQEADLSLTHAVAPHLFVTVTASAIRYRDVVAEVATLFDRRYFAGDLGLEWHAAQHWQVSFTGGYSQATDLEPYQYAHGWRAGVTLKWTPQPRSVSR
jgi:hypothetical protein